MPVRWNMPRSLLSLARDDSPCSTSIVTTSWRSSVVVKVLAARVGIDWFLGMIGLKRSPATRIPRLIRRDVEQDHLAHLAAEDA